MSQRRVLAVNHVFEILLYVANGESWADALAKAVPMRRGAQVREAAEAGGAEGGEEEEGGGGGGG